MAASRYPGSLAAFSAVAIALAGGSARADDKQACSAAYDATQALRHDKKIGDARAQADVCARDACAAFIRDDCVTWRGELEAAQPSVVIAATDPRGASTRAVRVALDGEPWLSSLDGKAQAIDPGQHTLRFELDGAPPVEQSVELAEGEKARTLTVSFAAPVAPAPPAMIPARVEDRSSPAPWIVGGVGVAGLVAGGVMGGLVVAARGALSTHCVFESGMGIVCDSQGASAAATVHTLAPATTIALVAGGAALATGTIWIVVRKSTAKTPPAAIGLAPAVSATERGLRISGSF